MALTVQISKEIFDELQRFKERHIPVVPFEPIKGSLYPTKPLDKSSINNLTDLDFRSLQVAGNGKIYSQYICIAGKRDPQVNIIEYKKNVIEISGAYNNINRKVIQIKKVIKRPVFNPAPNAIDLTEYFLQNRGLVKRIQYSSGCYYCKQAISSNTNLCEDCNRYYVCDNCNRCLCDKSETLLK